MSDLKEGPLLLPVPAVALGSVLSCTCRGALSHHSHCGNKAVKHVAAPGKSVFCSRGGCGPDKGNMLFSVLLYFLSSRWSVSRRLYFTHSSCP